MGLRRGLPLTPQRGDWSILGLAPASGGGRKPFRGWGGQEGRGGGSTPGAPGQPGPQHAFRTHALDAGMSAALQEVLAGQQSRGERSGPGTGDWALWKHGDGPAREGRDGSLSRM